MARGAEGHPLRRHLRVRVPGVVGVDQLDGIDELPGRRRVPGPRIDPRDVLGEHGWGQNGSAQVRKSGFLPGLGRWPGRGAVFTGLSCADCVGGPFGALFWSLNVAGVLVSVIGLPPALHNRTHRSATRKRKTLLSVARAAPCGGGRRRPPRESRAPVSKGRQQTSVGFFVGSFRTFRYRASAGDGVAGTSSVSASEGVCAVSATPADTSTSLGASLLEHAGLNPGPTATGCSSFGVSVHGHVPIIPETGSAGISHNIAQERQVPFDIFLVIPPALRNALRPIRRPGSRPCRPARFPAARESCRS